MAKKKTSDIEVIKKADIETKETEKAYFVKRFAAYILDIFLVSMVVSLIMMPIPENKNLTKLNKQMLEVNESYIEGEMSVDEYVNQSIGLSYDIAYHNVLFTIIDIVAIILYFVVFQFYNNGQTLGKKVLHIRVVKTDNSKLTMNDMIFRSLIINSLLVNILGLAITIFTNENIYFYGVNTLQVIQSVVLIISIFMMSFRHDGKGLQDFVAKTKVINEK